MNYLNEKSFIINYISKKFLNNDIEISEEQQNELKMNFKNFIFIDELCQYLTTTTTNHTIIRIDKKLDELYDIKVLENAINDYHENQRQINKKESLTLDKMICAMYKEDKKLGNYYSYKTEEDFKYNGMNMRKLSKYLRKDLGLVYYSKDYITKKELYKIILDDYNEGTFETKFTLNDLIKAMALKVISRSEDTGFYGKKSRKLRKNYILILYLDWGDENSLVGTDYRKIKELSEILCRQLSSAFPNEIKYIKLGVGSVHITMFQKIAKEAVSTRIRNNISINSKDITNQKYEKIMLKKEEKKKLMQLLFREHGDSKNSNEDI